MSTLQLACDTTNRVVVEWDKHPPHFRVITDSSHSRGYISEEAAMRAAKRLCRKLGLVLKPNRLPASYRLMAQEFPEFDQATLPPIPAGWTDSSWHNDACPSFVIEDLGIQIFIEEVDPAEREMVGGYRFNVLDCKSVETRDLQSTDIWQDVLAFVREYQA